jgi:UDP-glucuronate 4-epimerase
MSKILITGGAGFIGFHLQQQLKSKHEVKCIDSLRSEKTASIHRASFMQSVYRLDCSDDFSSTLVFQPDIIIHLAAETGVSDSEIFPERYIKTNIDATFNVLEQARKMGVKYFIYASSSSVYEPNQQIMAETSPTDFQLSFYGTTKKMMEQMVSNYCRQFGMTAIGLRFFTVYGSYTRPDMAGYKFMKGIQNGTPIKQYNHGEVLRDFTHVSDVVHSIELLLTKIANEPLGFHRVFNIGNSSPETVKKYIQLIAQELNKEPVISDFPLPKNELQATFSDSTSLELYTGYKPSVSIEVGVKEMVDWFKTGAYEK